EALIVQHFDRDFASKSAETFIQEILLRDLAVRRAVVGWAFCFGFQRGGDAELLRRRGRELGFEVTIVEPAATAGEIFSATRIREHLRSGEPEKAAELLGRPFEIE